MADDMMIVYGSDWCGDCRRTKRFLNEHNVPYQWIDIDRDYKAAELVMKLNRGYRSVPTIIFPDGSKLTEPSDEQLARKLGIEDG